MKIRNRLARLAVPGILGALVGAVLLPATAADAVTAESAGASKEPKPTVILVHGAFADSSSWNGVITRLRKQGYPVLAPANPLRSLKTDADALSTVVGSVEGPVVLVGHSYGGAVMSNAAVGHDNVKALVYVAAFAPDKGETALELSGRFPGSTLGDTLSPLPLGDGTNDLYIAQEKFRKQFAADVPKETAELMAITQRPIRDAALAESSGEPAWKSVPSWFVLAEDDLNIPLKAQQFMAKRALAKEIVQVRDASHAVGVSHPGVVADLIRTAARAIARS